MSILLENKVALVTGANRGIGKAIVETFLNRGVLKVYVAVRNVDSAEELVQKYGDRIQVVYVDIEKPETIAALAETAKDVQIVVNNAGVLKMSEPLSEDVEDSLDYEMKINVYGLLRVAKALTPVIEKNGGGAIVQLNSLASIKNFSAFSTYSASKAAAYSLTQGLRDTLKEKAITVVSVHPGPIDTDMARDAGFGEMVDSVQTVPDGIVAALESGSFHVFPDKMAKDFEQAYQGFAQGIVEANLNG